MAMRAPSRALSVLALAMFPATTVRGQEASVAELPPEREIALARSAAPGSVSGEATIWIWRNGDYDVAVQGTNGNGCLVARSQEGSLEPICYDPEGVRTLLEIERRRTRLRARGLDVSRVRSEVDRAIAAGELAVPSRPSLAWMMSSGQRLVSDDGRPVGAWKPHLMLYWPYLRASQLGLAEGSAEAFVDREGEALACLITIVPAFVDPPGA